MKNIATSESGYDVEKRETNEATPRSVAPYTIGPGPTPRENATASAAIGRADAGRRHQEPEAGRADVQDVVGERRDEDLEVHPERRPEARRR